MTSATLTAVHVDGTAVRNFVHGPRRKAVTAAAISVAVAGTASVLLAVPLFYWGGEGVTWPMMAIVAGAGVIVLVCYRVAGVDLLGATRNASLVVLVTMAFFGIELLTTGWLVYGQFLAVPVAIVAGICRYHRMQRAT